MSKFFLQTWRKKQSNDNSLPPVTFYDMTFAFFNDNYIANVENAESSSNIKRLKMQSTQGHCLNDVTDS